MRHSVCMYGLERERMSLSPMRCSLCVMFFFLLLPGGAGGTGGGIVSFPVPP